MIRLDGHQIRALIGKGGERIKAIRQTSGASITIDSFPKDPLGTVTIVGDVKAAEAMICEALAAQSQLRPNIPPEARPPPEPTNEDIPVPADMLEWLAGPGETNIREIRNQAGGECFISIVPGPSGDKHFVRVIGKGKEVAKHLIQKKLDELQFGPEPSALNPMMGTPPPPPPPLAFNNVSLFTGSHQIQQRGNVQLVGGVRPSGPAKVIRLQRHLPLPWG